MGDIDKNVDDRFCRHLGWALLAFLFVASLVNFRALYPCFVDVYYHMAVVEGFSQAGGLTLWDFWEYVPSGRPHVYPPVAHIGGLLLSKIGVTPYAYGTLLSWAMVPLSYILAWFLIRDTVGNRAAVVGLAFLAGAHAWFFSQMAHTANAVALCLAMGSIIAYNRKRFLIAAVMGILACGTHSAGWVAPITIVLASTVRPRELLTRALPVAGAALVGCAPWLWHVAKHREVITQRAARLQLDAFRVDYILVALALVGFAAAIVRIFAVRRDRKKELARAAILPAFLLSFGVMILLSLGFRFWGYSCFLPYACLAGVGANAGLALLEKRRGGRVAPRIAIALCVLLGLSVWPVYQPPLSRYSFKVGKDGVRERVRHRGRFYLEYPALVRMLTGKAYGKGAGLMVLGRTGLVPFLREVGRHLDPGDLVYCRGRRGVVATAMTGAWTTGGMLMDVMGPGPPGRPEQCRWALVFPGRRRARGVGARSGFEKISESKGMILYKNLHFSGTESGVPARAAVSTAILLLGAGGLLFLVCADLLPRRWSRPGRIIVVLLGVVLFMVPWVILAKSVSKELSGGVRSPQKNLTRPLQSGQ